MKVLLVGNEAKDPAKYAKFNQALAKYPIEVTKLSGDYGGDIPLHDVAIIISSATSKQKLLEVRENYHRWKKSILISQHDFYEIKNQFDDIIFNLNGMPSVPATPVEHKRIVTTSEERKRIIVKSQSPAPLQGQTAMHLDIQEEEEEDDAEDYDPKAKSRRWPSNEMMGQMYKTVIECYEANIGGPETIKYLETYGITHTREGGKFVPQDIYNYRAWLRSNPDRVRQLMGRDLQLPEEETARLTITKPALTEPLKMGVTKSLAQPPPAKIEPPRLVKPEPEFKDKQPISLALKDELITKILSSSIPPAEQLERIKRINAGEMIEDQAISRVVDGKFEIVLTSLLRPDEVLQTFSKEEVGLLIAFGPAMSRFYKE